MSDGSGENCDKNTMVEAISCDGSVMRSPASRTLAMLVGQES